MLEYLVVFEGRTPLVLHNIRLANPLDPYAKKIKAISSNRKKTEDHHLEMLRIEWEGGLYFDKSLGPYLPVSYPTACLRQAGAITRHKTALVRGLVLMATDGSERIRIEYDGPRSIEDMWADDEYRVIKPVRVGAARTLRSRPRFPDWRIEFRATIDEEILDGDDFAAICGRAGRNIGLGESPEGARARFNVALKEVPV